MASKRRGANRDLAEAFEALGQIEREIERGHAARPLEEEVRLYREGGGPSLDLANAIRSLAILKEAAGELEEARRLWEDAKDLYKSVGAREGAAECLARIARLTIR